MSVSYVKLLIPAGKASPSPPVGPVLGQRGIKTMDFCKQFNDRTKDIQADIPIPVVLAIKPDKSFTFVTKTPPTSYLLKRAANILKGASLPGIEPAGYITLKHVYEIAAVKQRDENMKNVSLEAICKGIIGSARSAGIEILMPDEPLIRAGRKFKEDHQAALESKEIAFWSETDHPGY